MSYGIAQADAPSPFSVTIEAAGLIGFWATLQAEGTNSQNITLWWSKGSKMMNSTT